MEQVRRDHLISHVLAALATDVSTNDLVFFGGTALSRTHLAARHRSCSQSLVAQNDAGDMEVGDRRYAPRPWDWRCPLLAGRTPMG